MAYTALNRMREMNRKEFGADIGPMPPELHKGEGGDYDLKSAALRFIHDRCERLRFDAEAEAREEKTGHWSGTSTGPGQIPYNMQMDIDRLCLEREVEAFIDSGVAEDAYNVYYCYLEMFFGRYGHSKKMVELLSEYETNGSSLLMKHRDHYSHSVYVFVLGLAIYETNVHYREAFKAFYGFGTDEKDVEQDNKAANFFLEYWGLTSLFHDIGYPFELPFEQVMSYFEVNQQKRGLDHLLIAYKNVEPIIAIGDGARVRFEALYNRTFHTVPELLAYDIAGKMGAAYGFSEGYLMSVLEKKPASPECFNCFMDHAYFSALRLYREIVDVIGVEQHPERREALKAAHVDALSAILLHNSLYKFSIAFYKDKSAGKPRLPMCTHPLAWLLMLCDELQCWDRTAYGRNSRTELQPMGVDFDFSGDRIVANYIYDVEEREKIEAYERSYRQWAESGCAGSPPRLKAYSDMAEEKNRFVRDIESIVDTGKCPLTVTCDRRKVINRKKHLYLSSSNFLHIHDFAVALNARYNYKGKEKDVTQAQLEAEFETLSLEYKLSNINQVKSFSRYLNAIQCFYTDRQVDFEMVREFTQDQIAIFAPMEHERWVREHRQMGWCYGTAYEEAPIPRGVNPSAYRKMLRENMRCHKLAMDGDPTTEEIYRHYEELQESEKDKDWAAFICMLKLIRKFDGLRIYRL